MTRTSRAGGAAGVPRAGPPVIGFLVDRIDDSYQHKLLAALVAATAELGASLICFCAGPAGQRRAGAEPHHAFHLASPDNIDALVLSTPTLTSAMGHAALMTQIARFPGIPVVSMGAEVEGIASIVLDNGDAMRQVTRHLVEHDCRRIACIRGPAGNIEAEERYQGYLRALADAGLDPEPQLVVEGDFHAESGVEAIRVLLDERGVRFDGLVAGNDEMAAAAIRELQQRGVRVPAEVKVTGFDDDVAAEYELPSLTTMRQRVAVLAWEAVKLALTGIDIDVSKRRHQLRTELVVRRSCGCPLEREQFSVAAPKRPDHVEHEPPLIQKRPELCLQMMAAAPALLSEEHANQLLDGFFAGLMNRSVTAFVESWDAVLREALRRDLDPRQYQPVTTALRRGAVPPLIQFPGMLLRAETMLHEARVLLANVVHQRATQLQLQERRLLGKLCEVAQSLIVAEDDFQLGSLLVPHLRELGIPGCCLAVYDPRHAAGARNRVRVVLQYRESKSAASDASHRFCYESELVSARFLSFEPGSATIALPLFFGDRKLGLVVFDVGTPDGTVYEAVRAQISAALQATSVNAEARAFNRDRELLIERLGLQLERLQLALRAAGPLQSESPQPGATPTAATERSLESGDTWERAASEATLRLADLEDTVRALADASAEPSTLRAPSDAQRSGVGVASKARKTGA
ncbi:MAG TPA: substrate-binding domain-containing protein [Polyangiaceae bacterium]